MSAHHHDIQVRWSDVDGLGHVNHVTVVTFLEVGRDATLASLGIPSEGYVVRRCEVDYVRELRPTGASVEYRCEAMTPGRTSVRTRETLRDAEGGIAVEAEFVIVMWDAQARQPRGLTDGEREILTAVGGDSAAR